MGGLGVEDFFNFIFDLFANDDRRWRRLNSIGDSIFMIGLLQSDMKDRVNVHTCRELELISLKADSLGDNKVADTLLVKLLTRAFGT